MSDALRDQLALLNLLPAGFGINPMRTLTTGTSMGGLLTAALIEANPTRFAGALPMCGSLAGSVDEWNQLGDFGFAIKTLFARSVPLDVVNIASPAANGQAAQSVANSAQSTAAGSARLALAAALGWMPDWYDTASPPAVGDIATRQQQAIEWVNFDLPFEFDLRAQMETRAAGMPTKHDPYRCRWARTNRP